MEAPCVSNGLFFTILYHRVIIILISVGQIIFMSSSSVFANDLTYTKTRPQKPYLELYETLYLKRSSAIACGIYCSENIRSSKQCLAFNYLPLDGACQLYGIGDTTDLLDAPVYRVHLKEDTFHDIYTPDHHFSLYRSSVKKNYQDARQHCLDMGGFLVEFHSLDKYAALLTVMADHISDDQFYVGASDLEDDGVWVTDRMGLALDTNTWLWADYEPSNSYGNEHCGTLVYMRINDVPCYYLFPYFCERDTN